MNAPEKIFLPDVQSHADRRNLAIQRVGVKDITHPLTVLTARGPQPTVASVDMYVALPPDVKGTHMSRFLEVLAAAHEPVSPAMLQRLMTTMLARLDADAGYVEMRLPYFVMKTAPVSGVESLMDYRVTMRVEAKAGTTTVTMQVLVPVTSLCPCSKNISEYGAHNQRSHVTIAATLRDELPVEALIAVAEGAASCELWGLLKRPDEKYVTERAYDNPKFVEDLVRDVALGIEAIDAVSAYTVESENFESIHNHSAYARIERVKA
ncbi:MAG: GTP cyclohydrolase FolE2 [Burkholderiaceae bacterium]|jgi:GTP cyclohydrolase I|nr:GTP cyclohydrolase I FolE2 [Burkholderiales bacterium]MCZ8101667.1 GTP cyclohydrolase FolE2 [Burkholderiales bacterium]MCZ8340080.1 GTP cyclohydrolase FolE2 [Burkholderiaceae bacterium]